MGVRPEEWRLLLEDIDDSMINYLKAESLQVWLNNTWVPEVWSSVEVE